MSAQNTPDSGKTFPPFKPGDTIKVHLKVVEGDSERIQVFEGTVIRRRGSGASESFMVRKVSFGVGVERIFPIHSPRIDRIEVVRSGRVRRARLYYLRNLSGRASRLQEDVSDAASKPAAKESAEAPSKAQKQTMPAAQQSRGSGAAPASLTT